VVERLVANEKVEGSTPFARSNKKVIKFKFLTSIFQNYLDDKDIRIFKNNIFYFLIFRIIRNFLAYDIRITIYGFKVFGSIKKNKTSYFLLKKCEFGDYQELNIIDKISKKKNVFFIDCGCNYGFYSFFTASLSKKNIIFSVEASKRTTEEFIKNQNLNNFSNINFFNKAISDTDNKNIVFNESTNDWESSQAHSDFKKILASKVETLKIDTLTRDYNFDNYQTIIKLDIEGNEMNALQGGIDFIKKTSPLIIIEISKYIFYKKANIEYLNSFLIKYDYSIYNTDKKKMTLKNILVKLNKLDKRFKTIGNYYLIKNSSVSLECVLYK
jgi:FkbM family methyltransferase